MEQNEPNNEKKDQTTDQNDQIENENNPIQDGNDQSEDSKEPNEKQILVTKASIYKDKALNMAKNGLIKTKNSLMSFLFPDEEPYIPTPTDELKGSFWMTRIVFLRGLALVYLISFLVAFDQNKELIGDRGLSPLKIHMKVWVNHHIYTIKFRSFKRSKFVTFRPWRNTTKT